MRGDLISHASEVAAGHCFADAETLHADKVEMLVTRYRPRVNIWPWLLWLGGARRRRRHYGFWRNSRQQEGRQRVDHWRRLHCPRRGLSPAAETGHHMMTGLPACRHAATRRFRGSTAQPRWLAVDAAHRRRVDIVSADGTAKIRRRRIINNMAGNAPSFSRFRTLRFMPLMPLLIPIRKRDEFSAASSQRAAARAR